MEQNSNNIESLLAAMPQEKKAIFNTWSAAHDELRDASAFAVDTRNDWAALFGVFDRKAKARDDREAAEKDLHDLSRKLKIKTLPISPDALAPVRKEAEAEAHERLRRAKANLAQAEIAMHAITGKKGG